MSKTPGLRQYGLPHPGFIEVEKVEVKIQNSKFK